MKQKVKLIIVMTVGPLGSSYTMEDLIDTLHSIVEYTSPDRRIIIQDNSSPVHMGEKISAMFPELTIIRSPENYGLYGGLYKAESLAFLCAHSMFDYQVLVRMDIDALVIAPGIEDDAAQYFALHPQVGILGNIQWQGEGTDWPRQQQLRQSGWLGFLRDSRRHRILNNLMVSAERGGWRPGQAVIGGAAIFNPLFINKLVREGLLLREEIRRLKLQEDHIFSLLCYAVGMELGDFHTGDKPMSISWRGLEVAPEELLKRNKKLIHSTRFWKDMREDAIRRFFRERRSVNQVR
jgi:hypothetical protein